MNKPLFIALLGVSLFLFISICAYSGSKSYVAPGFLSELGSKIYNPFQITKRSYFGLPLRGDEKYGAVVFRDKNQVADNLKHCLGNTSVDDEVKKLRSFIKEVNRMIPIYTEGKKGIVMTCNMKWTCMANIRLLREKIGTEYPIGLFDYFYCKQEDCGRRTLAFEGES